MMLCSSIIRRPPIAFRHMLARPTMRPTRRLLLPPRAAQLLRDAGPLYRQLAAILRAPIVDGTYPVGTELPKEAEIAERFGISLITVRQALRELESDGLIRKRAAKPAIVAARTPAPKLSSAFRNFADIAAYTRNARLEVASYRREAAEPPQAAFNLTESEAFYCLRSVLLVGDRPEAQITTWFPPEIGKRLKRSDFDDVLIFRAVERHLGLRLAGARITVRAEIADADDRPRPRLQRGRAGPRHGDALSHARP